MRMGVEKMDKDLRKIVNALENQDFDVQTTKRGNLAVFRDGALIATFSGTSSDWRAIRNGLAPLKRAGFRWPPRR
jgi:hypothetical protein